MEGKPTKKKKRKTKCVSLLKLVLSKKFKTMLSDTEAARLQQRELNGDHLSSRELFSLATYYARLAEIARRDPDDLDYLSDISEDAQQRSSESEPSPASSSSSSETNIAVKLSEDIPLTDDQAKLYDRQIRLWGVDAQKRLINSRILVIGLGGLGAELSKNIILGGVNSVILMDHNVVSNIDTSCQFLVPRDSIGKNRAESSLTYAQQLNPMVNVKADISNPDDKPDNFYTEFTVIIATGCTNAQILRLNGIARLNNIGFFSGDVFGFVGYMFSDLGEHKYKKEIKIPAAKDIPEKTKVIDGVAHFVPFQDVLNLDWTLDELSQRVKKTDPSFFALFVLLEFIEKEKRRPDPAKRESDYQELLKLRDAYIERNKIPLYREKKSKDNSKEPFLEDALFANVFGELAPIAAITGGVIAQEVVKAVSQKDEPLVNLFVYNPVAGTGYVENFAN